MPLIRLLFGRVLLVLMFMYAGLARGESLTIAGDIWCPVNCEMGSAKPGIFVELVREIFAESGIEVQYQSINWARTLQRVRRGSLNGAIGAGVEDAPDFLFHQVPMGLSRFCFYTRKDSTWQWQGVQSLEGQRLGVINDYSYGEILNQYVEAHRDDSSRVQLASGDRALALSLGKLQRNRLDVVLENPWVVESMLAEQGRPGSLRNAGCRKLDAPIYIAFSPALESSKRYAKILDEGLKLFRADGRLKAIYDKYGVSEY